MSSRIFISYSSKDDPEALTIRDAVYAALKAAGHAVFLDARDLPPGEAWRRKIRRELAECQAGVILFTRGALTSDWVWHEASILSFVREFASTFKLISVPLQDVKLEDLKTPRFAPLGLYDFQLTQNRTLPALTQELVQELGIVTEQKTLLEHLAERIGLALSGLTAPWLESVAKGLGASTAQWRPDRGLSDTAKAVARAVLGEGMEGVHKAISALAPELRSARAQTLLDELAPLWAPHESAARILRIAQRGPSPWCIGLNGKRVATFTAGMFVYRAYWPRRVDVFKVRAGTGEDLLGHIQEELLESVRASRNYDSIDEAEEYLLETEEPIFVTLPRSIWDAAALKQLRKAYPNVTFILDTGEGCLQEGDPSMPSEFEALPEVDVSEEKRAWIKYGDAKGVIGKYP